MAKKNRDLPPEVAAARLEQKRQAARLAGQKSRIRGNPEAAARLGALGGKVIRERHKDDPEFFRRMGEKGGEAIKEKYGPEYFREIGKKGGSKSKPPRKPKAVIPEQKLEQLEEP